MNKAFLGAVALGVAIVAPASVEAASIPGPSLDALDGGWSTTGVSFVANQNLDLTAFTFQSQGQADTVVLADSSGTVLHSVASSGGVTNVNWGLAAGHSYWLLQTTASNAHFAGWNGTNPSNGDISLLNTGNFAFSVSGAVSGAGFIGSSYWAAFNDITTSSASSPAPEPASWAMMLGGFGLVGGAMRSRRKAGVSFA